LTAQCFDGKIRHPGFNLAHKKPNIALTLGDFLLKARGKDVFTSF